MIDKIIHFSVYHRGVVLFITALIIIAGAWSFQHLPIDAVPDITNIQVQINTPIQGLAPEETERTVTFRIEAAMGGIPGVTQVRSLTRFDLSQVTVVFEDGTDIYRARQLITERLQEVIGDLPGNVKPKLGPVTTGLGEIIHYEIEMEKVAAHEERMGQLMELRALQEYFVKPRLLTVKGVADVGTIGGYQKLFLVQPIPHAMTQWGIHLEDIGEAIEKTNRNVGSGYVQQTGEQFVVQGVGRLKTVEEIREVPVKILENFRTIRVGDIAQVEIGPDLRMGAGLVNGKEAVVGTVMMLVGENSRTVSDRVAKKIEEIQESLPQGVQLKILYNRSDLVNATLSTVEHNLLFGAILVVLILLLLLGNLRAAIITAFAIPFSLLMTFLLMRYFGISGNLMSLGALDFGVIVDGVVIVLDNCVRTIGERRKILGRYLTRSEVSEAVLEGTIQIRTAAGFGELIILMAFLPIFAFTGVEGKMFIPMAATFMIALFAALLLSFTTAPALASLFLSRKTDDKEPFLMRWIKILYRPLLNGALRYSRMTLALGGVAVLLGIVLFLRMGGEFLPRLNEGSILIQFVRPANISIDQSIALQEISEKIIRDFPEVKDVFSKVGTADVATDPMPIYFVDTFITLKDKKELSQDDKSPRDKKELIQAMMTRLEEEVPGQRMLVTQPIEMRFNELLEGVRSDISLKIFGDDMKVLGELAESAVEIIQKIPGSDDVETDAMGKSLLLRIEPKEEVLRKLGITKDEILETIAIAIGGRGAGTIYEGYRSYPIVIRLEEKMRSNLETLEEIPVGVFANKMVPLGELADLHFEEMYGTILREQAKRRAAVMINSRDRDVESLVKEAEKAVQQEVKLPPQYYLEWGGNFKNLMEAKRRLILLTPLVLLLVFLMVYAAFRNFLQAVLIFACVPLALVGGVLNMLIMGLPFSISAGVGFMALSGIAVLNGVVLTNFYNDLRKEGLSGLDLIRKGALVRLRPVMMTALVEIFGFLPMMLSQGMGAEVQRPLATVVIGGVFSSTLLTLLILPALYKLLESRIFVRTVGKEIA